MTITYNIDGDDVVVYTDGLCFVDHNNMFNIPGLSIPNVSAISYQAANSRFFNLEEGYWWIPVDYRMCVFTANEIMSSNFLDITRRISIDGGYFLKLELEIELDPSFPGGLPDRYYNIWLYDEDRMLEELSIDLDILHTGNLIYWKNDIEVIDRLYGSTTSNISS